MKPLVQGTLSFSNSPAANARAGSSSGRNESTKKRAPFIKESVRKTPQYIKSTQREIVLDDSEDDGKWGANELSFISASQHRGFGTKKHNVDRKGKGKAPQLEFVEGGENQSDIAGGVHANDQFDEPRPATPSRIEPELEPDTEDELDVFPPKPSPVVLVADSDDESNESMEVHNLLLHRQSISPGKQQHPRTDDSGFADGPAPTLKPYDSEQEEDYDAGYESEGEGNCTAEVQAQLLCLVPDTQDQERPSPIKASLFSPESCFLVGGTQYPASPTPSSPLSSLAHSPFLSPCRPAAVLTSDSPTRPPRPKKLTGFTSVDQAWAGQQISPPKVFSPRQSRMTDFFAGPAQNDDEMIIADSQALPFFLDAVRSAIATTSRNRDRLTAVAEDEEAEDIEEPEDRQTIVPTSDAEDEAGIPLYEDEEFLARLRVGKFSRQNRLGQSPSPVKALAPSPAVEEAAHASSAPDERFLPESMLHFLGEFDETGEESIR